MTVSGLAVILINNFEYDYEYFTKFQLKHVRDAFVFAVDILLITHGWAINFNFRPQVLVRAFLLPSPKRCTRLPPCHEVRSGRGRPRRVFLSRLSPPFWTNTFQQIVTVVKSCVFLKLWPNEFKQMWCEIRNSFFPADSSFPYPDYIDNLASLNDIYR